MAAKPFLDSNILIYLLSDDSSKADCAEGLLRHGGIISVQVLNEVTHVMRRKLRLEWTEIREFLSLVRSFVTVEPLTVEIHEQGLQLAERYGFSLYDAMIVASALTAGCSRLMSEDMQDGLRVDGRLEIGNPFGKISSS